ncbi:uncharacterized protein LOC134192512 [Corticium candelabrum]|uniref:uncharacterized protein LOC134192512 n=1 Tax=Corticium candelabrum TaxID=121492 RepID=UPI002E25ACD0|nr:uncharacterized protein LOC134192512 [Corticium candelabrum]
MSWVLFLSFLGFTICTAAEVPTAPKDVREPDSDGQVRQRNSELNLLRSLDYFYPDKPVNKWNISQISQSRQLNTPTPAAQIRAAVYVRYDDQTPEEERDRLHRVLLFGGWEAFDLLSITQPRGTWIYTPIVNSWFRLPRTQLQPRDRLGHSLTTICANEVVLYGGHTNSYVYDRKDCGDCSSRNSSCRDPSTTQDLWIFDGVQETWEQINVTNDSPPRRAFHSAVAFGSTSNNSSSGACRCHQSLLIFGGVGESATNLSDKRLDDLWELKCVDGGDGNGTYQWTRHQRKFPWPAMRSLHFSFVRGNEMIMYGGVLDVASVKAEADRFWSLDVRSMKWTWKSYCRSQQASSLIYNLLTSSAQSSSFVFEKDKNRIILIQTRCVFSLSLTASPFWQRHDLFNVDAAPVDMTDFTAVSVNGKIIVFSGIEAHNNYQNIRVWELAESNGVWVWQLRPLPRRDPPVHPLVSWNLAGNQIIFSGSTSPSWAGKFKKVWSQIRDSFINNEISVTFS